MHLLKKLAAHERWSMGAETGHKIDSKVIEMNKADDSHERCSEGNTKIPLSQNTLVFISIHFLDWSMTAVSIPVSSNFGHKYFMTSS